jgi:electron transfer flavoprotein alpha subunit
MERGTVLTETLVLIEHDAHQVRRPSLHAISAARRLGVPYDLLVLGHDIGSLSASLSGFGAATVHVADDPALAHPLADRYAAVIAQVARAIEARTLLGTSSTFTKDLLPHAAALLDAPMLSDVVSIETQDGNQIYTRPVCAGSALAQVVVDGARRVLTVRSAAFDVPEPTDSLSIVRRVQLDPARLPAGMRFISRESRPADRPELTDARVVVAGGRPLKDRETYDRLVTALADVLGGAVGATRAAVDAGVVPNDWQIGQTGKVIAPDLYIALGVSGAIQHLAGIKDSRVIVAINKDADAPIFEVANYGIVGDLFQLAPELIDKLTRTLDGRN